MTVDEFRAQLDPKKTQGQERGESETLCAESVKVDCVDSREEHDLFGESFVESQLERDGRGRPGWESVGVLRRPWDLLRKSTRAASAEWTWEERRKRKRKEKQTLALVDTLSLPNSV